MIAFEVHPNGKRACTAGVGQLGVLSACCYVVGIEWFTLVVQATTGRYLAIRNE